MSLRIVGGRVLGPRGWIQADVLLDGESIVFVGAPRETATGETEPSRERVDAAGLWVVPGFIDLQINGGFGHDFTSRPTSIWEVGAALPRHGVTAFLPTLVSSPPSVAQEAMNAVLAGPPTGYAGATPLGLHCEGPMLAGQRRGVHERRHLTKPSLRVIEKWAPSAGVRMVTMAPELPGSDVVVRELVERGVVVSAGHSDAAFEEALKGFHAGISSGTHLFNAMKPFHHREPGLAGALLARPDVVTGLIADGIHVHPGAVALAWRAKGSSGLALVSDAMALMGTDLTTADLGGVTVSVEGAAPRSGGRLAGSLLTLDHAVRNVMEWAECELEEAIASVTSTPARLLGEHRRGVIEPGAVADLVLLTPQLTVVATIAGGHIVFDQRETVTREGGVGGSSSEAKPSVPPHLKRDIHR